MTQILLPEEHEDFKVSPENGVGESFNFIGGDLSTFDELMSKYREKGVDVDKVYVYDPEAIEQDIPAVLDLPEENYLRIPLCANVENDGVITCDEDKLADGTQTQLTYPCVKYTNDYIPVGCNEDPPIPRYAHEWETSVIVYEASGCDNPNQSKKIEGYVTVTVFNVGWPSHKAVDARIECDLVSADDTRGGGANLGVFGSIPGLVEGSIPEIVE
jgi:hypothetical protein